MQPPIDILAELRALGAQADGQRAWALVEYLRAQWPAFGKLMNEGATVPEPIFIAWLVNQSPGVFGFLYLFPDAQRGVMRIRELILERMKDNADAIGTEQMHAQLGADGMDSISHEAGWRNSRRNRSLSKRGKGRVGD